MTDMRTWDQVFGGRSRPPSMTPTKHSGPPVCKTFKTHGLRYRHTHEVKDKQGRTIVWCWSTTRNDDGFFVAFREVRKGDIGFRDKFRQRKARWRCKDWALDQFNKSPHRKVWWTYPLKRDKKKA